MNQPSPHVWSGWIWDDDLNNVSHDPMSTIATQNQIPVNEHSHSTLLTSHIDTSINIELRLNPNPYFIVTNNPLNTVIRNCLQKIFSSFVEIHSMRTVY